MEVIHHEDSYVYFIINPAHTNYVNRILEGYEYLGVMTTVNRSEGLCVVRSTEDTRDTVKEVLSSLDIGLTFVDPNTL